MCRADAVSLPSFFLASTLGKMASVRSHTNENSHTKKSLGWFPREEAQHLKQGLEFVNLNIFYSSGVVDVV